MKQYLVNGMTILAGKRLTIGLNSIFRLRESEGFLVLQALRYVQNLFVSFDHRVWKRWIFEKLFRFIVTLAVKRKTKSYPAPTN